MPTKSAVSSLTLWGVLLTAFCTYCPKLAAALHLGDADTQQAIAALIGGVGTTIGLVVTVYGRLNATQAISGLFKAKPAAASTTGSPPAAANLMLALIALPLALAVIGSLSACSTVGGGTTNVSAASTSSTSAALRMTEGKALTAAYDAGDALAVGLDAAAKSGALIGSSATKARQALMDLQVALSTAQSAYAAGDATTAGQIASLASLLSSAAYAVPLSSTDQTLVQSAIQLASAFAAS